MANDPNPQLRAELNAALAVLQPQIRGLHDLSAVSISADLQSSVRNEITARERRRDLIQAVLNNLDTTLSSLIALEHDGYPALPSTQMVPAQFEELQGQSADLTAAIKVFAEQPVASQMTVALGQPAEKPPTE
jgi:hypothetical protein